MKMCKTNIKQLEYNRQYRQTNKAKLTRYAKQYRWEKIHLIRSQRETLALIERKGIYDNCENPCTCAHCSH